MPISATHADELGKGWKFDKQFGLFIAWGGGGTKKEREKVFWIGRINHRIVKDLLQN